MQTQDIFIIQPKTTEQVDVLKVLVKALKLKFEITNEQLYNKNFVKKIEQSRKQYNEGNFTVIKTEDLWK
jgi:hypothetical protein